jgi:murein endopeptidase
VRRPLVLLLTCLTAGLFIAGSPRAASATPFPAAWLPQEGDGYLIPPKWAERGLRYGTPELVGLIERAARTVQDEVPGAVLYVADLSLRTGAFTQWHRSHRNGCDADLIFFATDDDGEPEPEPRAMSRYDAEGVAWATDEDGQPVRLHFDTERNWALVKALLADDEAHIARIFISWPLRARLLEYAASQDEEPTLVARAAEVLAQPGDSEAHDDHMHIRIAPPPGVEEIVPKRIERIYARAGKGATHRMAAQKLGRHKAVAKKKAGKRSSARHGRAG